MAQVTISPGETRSRPAACATIFSASVLAMWLTSLSGPVSRACGLSVDHNTSRSTRKMLQERSVMTVAKANGLPARLDEAESARGIVVAPGVYDALSASIAAAAGFDTLYLSG